MGWQSYVAFCGNEDEEIKVQDAINEHGNQEKFVGGLLIGIQHWRMANGKTCYIFGNDCGRLSTYQYFKDNGVELVPYEDFDRDCLTDRL